MTDKCKRCKRLLAADEEQFESDEDGKMCARHLDVRYRKLEYTSDCWAHLAHVQNLKLMKATSLLRSAEMASHMSAGYQASCAADIRAFLVDPTTEELVS